MKKTICLLAFFFSFQCLFANDNGGQFIKREVVYYNLFLDENAPLLRRNHELVQYMMDGVMKGQLSAYSIDTIGEQLLTLEDWMAAISFPPVYYEDCNWCADEEVEYEEHNPLDYLFYARDLYQIEVDRSLFLTNKKDTLVNINYIHVYLPADHIENVLGVRTYAFSVKGEEFKTYLESYFPNDLFHNSPTHVFWKGDVVLSADRYLRDALSLTYLSYTLQDSLIIEQANAFLDASGNRGVFMEGDRFDEISFYIEYFFVEEADKLKEISVYLACFPYDSHICEGTKVISTTPNKLNEARKEAKYELYSPFEYLLQGSLKPDSVVTVNKGSQGTVYEPHTNQQAKKFEVGYTEIYNDHRLENYSLTKDSGFVQMLYLATLNGEVDVYDFSGEEFILLSKEEARTNCIVEDFLFEDEENDETKSYKSSSYYSAEHMNMFLQVSTRYFDFNGKQKGEINIEYITIWVPVDHPENIKGVEFPLFALKWEDVKSYFKRNKKVIPEGKTWVNGLEKRKYQPALLKTSHPKRLN